MMIGRRMMIRRGGIVSIVDGIGMMMIVGRGGIDIVVISMS